MFSLLLFERGRVFLAVWAGCGGGVIFVAVWAKVRRACLFLLLFGRAGERMCIFFTVWARRACLFLLFGRCRVYFFAVWARAYSFFCCLRGGREFTHLPVCLAQL